MSDSSIHDRRERTAPTGRFVDLGGERYYRISAYDLMPPFLMNIPTPTDIWAFVSSAGGLTAGRVDPDGALFPYETEDRLHDAHHHTGPVTLVRILAARKGMPVWEPLRGALPAGDGIERNLYKNVEGNRLVFEEVRGDLGLSFRYRWSACDRFGLVRTARLSNTGRRRIELTVLDGLRNVLPFGAPLGLYQSSSSLVDAYKRVDLDSETGMAIFSLTSRIIDRAEAAEELRANVVWCSGLPSPAVSLSLEAVREFASGGTPAQETVLTGRRGNYLARADLVLEPGETATWHIAADAGLDHIRIAALRKSLLEEGDIAGSIGEALDGATGELRRIVAAADGLQLTAREETTAHHFSDVLFNCMRGGIFDDGYAVGRDDLARFIRARNRDVAQRQEGFLRSLPGRLAYQDLLERSRRAGDADLERLCLEYLPIWFGRRHGDPSRPWNRFSIRVREPDGGRALRFEGNWRDIFQNWEALAASYPGFLPGIVATFVDASTLDGFNPYRITQDGIGWEVIDPDDPWSYIGYWGDHQIVYLMKFLDAMRRCSPGTLEEMLGREIFTYADVPYRIRPYGDLLADPDATIDFDSALAAAIEERVRRIGSDGRLVHDSDGGFRHASLLEKLLVPVLAKISNLVADGGIWMNTQRPEWNDANNALVGHGLSMVTLCYLRRHLRLLGDLFESAGERSIPVSTEAVRWMREIGSILERHAPVLDGETIGDGDRKRLLDDLGGAFSAYRETVYAHGLSGKEALGTGEARGFCVTANRFLDHAIRANRRSDGLYHSYNLLGIRDEGLSIRQLYEMLEGQVAALSSGVIAPGEAAQLLDALFDSAMYRKDVRSFMLYPERILPGFLERNVVPGERVSAIGLLTACVEAGEGSIVGRDASGVFRFAGGLSNARDLSAALERLGRLPQWKAAVERDRRAVLDLFEDIFDHHAFTGRSGTMYGYEGLGCVYWHMVAKLLLAVQEIALRAFDDGEPPVADRLIDAYYRIRAGLGFERTPAEYGAFPTDPYSHTPPHGGARQPGMTGQVKEEILTRLGELGVRVDGGLVSFRPVMLQSTELIDEPAVFEYVRLDGSPASLDLPAGSLAFTFCGVPVVYRATGEKASIEINSPGGARKRIDGDTLDPRTSRALLGRTGEIVRIDVLVPEGLPR
jgi:hypothetical protein